MQTYGFLHRTRTCIHTQWPIVFISVEVITAYFHFGFGLHLNFGPSSFKHFHSCLIFESSCIGFRSVGSVYWSIFNTNSDIIIPSNQNRNETKLNTQHLKSISLSLPLPLPPIEVMIDFSVSSLKFTDDYTVVWIPAEWANDGDDDDADAMWTVDRRWAHLGDSVHLAVIQIKFPS